jgi:hypothetical protein
VRAIFETHGASFLQPFMVLVPTLTTLLVRRPMNPTVQKEG